MDRAIQVAVKKYPHGTFDGEIGDSLRAACAVGYMQAQKETVQRMRDELKSRKKIAVGMSKSGVGFTQNNPVIEFAISEYDDLLSFLDELEKE